mgnify:CR=1 FL=1
MNYFTIAAICVSTTLFVSPTFASPDHHGENAIHAAHDTDAPVNTMCPIGKEATVDGVPSLEYKGNTIAFCCPGCSDEFMGWEESARDYFVANAKMGIYEVADEPAAKAPATKAEIAYPFNTCPISGGELGGMGDPIVMVYDGREVKFCCAMCIPTFEKDLKASFKALDQKIIDSQIKFYPMTTCLVSDEPIQGENTDEPINFVYKNRLIQTCCKMCISKFKKNPEAYIAKLDQAVIAQQSKMYPLTSCPISGEELGSMGDPIQVVYQGRLVKFCCSMCIPQFEADPIPTIAKIDAAWMAMHKTSHP